MPKRKHTSPVRNQSTMDNRKRKAPHLDEDNEETGVPTPGGPNDPARKGARKIRKRVPMIEDEVEESDDIDQEAIAGSSRRKKNTALSTKASVKATKPTRAQTRRKPRSVVESSPDVSSDEETDDSELEWTEKDEFLLKRTDISEVALWKKTQRMFGVFPPQILPDGIEFDFTKHKLLDFNGTKIENSNLSHDLCDMLCQLISCAAFERRLDFLKYVIRYALFVRIGAPTYTKPRESELNILHAGILEDYRKASSFEADDGALLKVLRDRLGPDLPTHYDFVKEIKPSNPLYKDQPGLIKRDIMNIIDAWDRYAAKNSNLKTIRDYAKDWRSIPNNVVKGRAKNKVELQQYSTERTLELKKEWILSQRPKRKHKRARAVDSDSITPQLEEENFQGGQDHTAPSEILGGVTPRRRVLTPLISSPSLPNNLESGRQPIRKVQSEVWDKYPKPEDAHRIFQTMRPYPGAYTGEDETSFMKNTRGIDALLILLRHLHTLAWEPPCDDEGKKLTEPSVAIHEAVMRNLGWNEEQDWSIKKSLATVFSKWSISIGGTFTELYNHGQIRDLLRDNMLLQLRSNIAAFNRNEGEGPDDWALTELEEESLWKQDIVWKGKESLSDFLSAYVREPLPLVDGSPRKTQMTQRPTFLTIFYKAESENLHSIADIRVIQFDAVEIGEERDGDKTIVREFMFKSTFHLVAVIRLAKDGVQDDIRTYGTDGVEIVPPEFPPGFHAKDFTALESWTIKSPGDYLLCYHRQDRIQTGMNVDAPEVEPRSWVAIYHQEMAEAEALGQSGPSSQEDLFNSQHSSSN